MLGETSHAFEMNNALETTRAAKTIFAVTKRVLRRLTNRNYILEDYCYGLQALTVVIIMLNKLPDLYIIRVCGDSGFETLDIFP